MRSKPINVMVMLAAVACAAVFSSRTMAGSLYNRCAATASMYYPWAGQFPWDRPGTVNPDVISGPLVSTSMHWPAPSNYGHYRPMFAAYFCACRWRGECGIRGRW